MNNEREQIINYLLGQCDQKNKVIEELQKQMAELNKQLAMKAVAEQQKSE